MKDQRSSPGSKVIPKVRGQLAFDLSVVGHSSTPARVSVGKIRDEIGLGTLDLHLNVVLIKTEGAMHAWKVYHIASVSKLYLFFFSPFPPSFFSLSKFDPFFLFFSFFIYFASSFYIWIIYKFTLQ